MANPVYQLVLCDRQNNELADISEISSEKSRSRWLSGAQVWSFRVPAADPLVSTVHTDGYRYLAKLCRALKVRRTPPGGGSQAIVANLLVVRIDWTGDKEEAHAVVTCIDPMWWWRRRPVRDALGRFALPTFPSPYTAPEMLLTAIEQSIAEEGTLGLNTGDGTFDTSGPDLAMKVENWPMMISEFAVDLSRTGALDIKITPVDTADGYGLEDGLAIMGVLNGYHQAGSDLTGTVHFDYATGDFSADACTFTEDADTIANRLYYYLAPRRGARRYQGNITPPADGTPFDGTADGYDDLRDTALETARLASIALYGQFFDIDVFDSVGKENTIRPVFNKLWQTELRLRVNGRELIKITPSFECEFLPYQHYNPGDLVALNTGAALGPVLTDAPVRLYGEKSTIDEDGVEHPGELIVSADGEAL